MIVAFILYFIGELIEMKYLGDIYSLGVLIPSIAVGVRRMHDVGKSGWFLIIPIVNIALALTDGEKGVNQYGPNPKATKQ